MCYPAPPDPSTHGPNRPTPLPTLKISKLAVLKTLGLRCMIKVSTPGVATAGRVLAKQGGKTKEILVIVQGACRLVTTAPRWHG